MTGLDVAAAIYGLIMVIFLALIVKHDTNHVRPYRLPGTAIDLLTAIYCVAWPALVVMVVWRRWFAKKAIRRP